MTSFHFNFHQHLKFSSTTLNNILSSSNHQIFYFLIFMFVSICQNLSFESLLSNFPGAEPFHLNDSLASFPEKERTIYKSLFHTLPCSKLSHVGNHCLTCLICNVRTTNRFEIKSRDQDEDVTYINFLGYEAFPV